MVWHVLTVIFLFGEWPLMLLTPLHVLPFLVLFPIILLDMQPKINDWQIIKCFHEQSKYVVNGK